MADEKKQREKEDPLAQEIGQRILLARNGLGWSQQALHAHTKLSDKDGLGISRAVLSLYETGVNKPGSREIRLLCEALKITPNWLLFGSDNPLEAIQPSMAFLRGDDLTLSVRLAFAILAISPQERGAHASLIFSSLSKTMPDTEMSGMLSMASLMANVFYKDILEIVGAESKNLPIRDLIKLYVKRMHEGTYSNWGTLQRVLTDEEIDNLDINIPPPRNLEGS